MIISLRGTSGSGKTTVVREILKQRSPVTVVERSIGIRQNKPLVYAAYGSIPPIYIFGSYETVCGGCDTINDYKNVVPDLLTKYVSQGHVLFESLLISGTYGAIGQRMSELGLAGHETVCAFLDTPLDVCLQRIGDRRKMRGDDRQLNPKNTIQKFSHIDGTKKRCIDHGLRVVDIDYRDPVQGVLRLLEDARWPI